MTIAFGTRRSLAAPPRFRLLSEGMFDITLSVGASGLLTLNGTRAATSASPAHPNHAHRELLEALLPY
jgi:hypothetical protein